MADHLVGYHISARGAQLYLLSESSMFGGLKYRI